MLSFRPNVSYYGTFKPKLLKTMVIFYISKKIYQNIKFHIKKKKNTSVTKISLFEDFWTGICKKLLSYLNLAPSNLSEKSF